MAPVRLDAPTGVSYMTVLGTVSHVLSGMLRYVESKELDMLNRTLCNWTVIQLESIWRANG